jgi:hypothetical protein
MLVYQRVIGKFMELNGGISSKQCWITRGYIAQTLSGAVFETSLAPSPNPITVRQWLAPLPDCE